MTDRNTYRGVVLPLVFALVVVALAGIALSGAVMAESNTEEATEGPVVQTAHSFVVEDMQTNSPVTEGETLVVDAVITNDGRESGRDRVELAIDEPDNVVDGEDISLDPGESTQVSLRWQTEAGDARETVAGVLTNDEEQTDNVVVAEADPANFQVTIDSTNSPVTEGDPLEVDATIENTGDESGAQEVVLSINGNDVDGAGIELAGGESTTETFVWSDTEVGEYRTTVSSEDDGHTVETAVEEAAPADFQVTIDSTNSPVTEGDPLEVTATIENTGDEEETKPVELYIGHGLEDDMSVSLAGGESVTRTLSWDTTEADEYTAMVRTPDDSVSESVVVEEPDPAYFEVTIDSTNSPVTEGDPLEVTATIENTGDEGAEQQVGLLIGEDAEDSTVVGLNGGDSTTETFTWSDTEVGDYTVEVRSDNDGDTELVEVQEPDSVNFEVSIDSTNSPVTEGNSLEVDATIENTGNEGSAQDIVLTIDGQEFDVIEGLRLGGGDSRTVTLSWDETREGTYHAQVHSSDDQSDEARVSVQSDDDERPFFDVEILDATEKVEEGEDARVIVSVENTGDESAGQEITLEIGEYGEVDSDSVRLEPGDTHRMTLIWETESGDAGDHRAIVASEDTEDATGIHVEGDEYTPDAAEFAVDSLDTNTPREGEELLATAEVTNVGGEAGEQTVELRINGDTVDHTDVMLDPEESERVRLSWATEVGDAGEHEVVVASADDTARETVSVREDTDDPYLDVDILGTNTPVEGSDITVRVEVENLGEETGEQEITLDIDGLDTGDAEPVTLDGGASTTLELSAETSAGDSGTYTAVVSSADASDRASVGIRTATDPDPAAFGVTIVETNSPVSSGELLEVVVQVENTGDESDRQRLDLILDGEVRDNTEIQLGPGDQQTVTFEWLPRAGQEGDHELAVMSDDDRDTTTVSVVDEGFVVSALSTNSPVEPGETIHVEAEITNVGEGTDTQTVQLRLANGDTTETTRDVQLAGGESETLTWETEASEAGTYELSAQTDDHRESTQLQVEGDTPEDREGDREAGSTFTVTIDSVESNGDGTIQVEATVENTDEMEDTQNVVVEHDGVEQGSQEVTLLGGESESLVFSLSPSSDDIDVVDLEVSSETDFDTSSIDLSVEGPDGTDDTDDSDSLLTSPFPYLLVLVLLVVGGGYYYRRRR